ncbi:thiol-disulfide oxidoreductase [Geobacter sulfurreducens]|jgi:predicted DCC family thiol-disulfide oxidoreductase YuxK|nr:thiol-disulfide oxidoreductase [Geobacter sulfurreducens]
MKSPRFPLRVFYDGSCIVCATEIEHYLKKDHDDKLVAVDISSPDFDPMLYQISLADFMFQLHSIDQDGLVFKGVDSFWAIWQAFPSSTIYGLMGRIIQLPLVNRLARIGYWLFARVRPYLPKRHQCDNGTCSIHHKR